MERCAYVLCVNERVRLNSFLFAGEAQKRRRTERDKERTKREEESSKFVLENLRKNSRDSTN